jgi:hypothetical protein
MDASARGTAPLHPISHTPTYTWPTCPHAQHAPIHPLMPPFARSGHRRRCSLSRAVPCCSGKSTKQRGSTIIVRPTCAFHKRPSSPKAASWPVRRRPVWRRETRGARRTVCPIPWSCALTRSYRCVYVHRCMYVCMHVCMYVPVCLSPFLPLSLRILRGLGWV